MIDKTGKVLALMDLPFWGGGGGRPIVYKHTNDMYQLQTVISMPETLKQGGGIWVWRGGEGW